jgi:hypothetical protein
VWTGRDTRCQSTVALGRGDSETANRRGESQRESPTNGGARPVSNGASTDREPAWSNQRVYNRMLGRRSALRCRNERSTTLRRFTIGWILRKEQSGSPSMTRIQHHGTGIQPTNASSRRDSGGSEPETPEQMTQIRTKTVRPRRCTLISNRQPAADCAASVRTKSPRHRHAAVVNPQVSRALRRLSMSISGA